MWARVTCGWAALLLLGASGTAAEGAPRLEVGYAAQLYSLRVSDGRVRQLTDGGEYSGGKWSPDGRRIAAIESVRVAAEVGDRTSVVVMDADGGRLRRVTPSRRDGANAFSWSPDGRRLAVMTRDGRREALEIWRPATGAHRRLAWWFDDEADSAPEWSPDGRRIVFARPYGDPAPDDRFVGHAQGQFDLVVADVRTGALRRLTRTPQDEQAPIWSPNGREVLCTRGPAGSSGRLELVAVRGGRSRRFGPRTVDVGTAWSPDGRRLVLFGIFTRGNRTDHLYLARLHPFRLRQLSDIAPDTADFAPGGRTLDYVSGNEMRSVRLDGSHDRALGRLPGRDTQIEGFDSNPHGSTLLLTASIPPPAD